MPAKTIVNFLKAGALFAELPADGIAALAAAAREGARRHARRRRGLVSEERGRLIVHSVEALRELDEAGNG